MPALAVGYSYSIDLNLYVAVVNTKKMRKTNNYSRVFVIRAARNIFPDLDVPSTNFVSPNILTVSIFFSNFDFRILFSGLCHIPIDSSM